MQMQPLPQPSRCVHTPAAPGTRAGTRGDTSILHPHHMCMSTHPCLLLRLTYLPSYGCSNSAEGSAGAKVQGMACAP